MPYCRRLGHSSLQRDIGHIFELDGLQPNHSGAHESAPPASIPLAPGHSGRRWADPGRDMGDERRNVAIITYNTCNDKSRKPDYASLIEPTSRAIGPK